MPYTQSGIDDEVVQSFIAALQLGLKKRFGGKVDHLRITNASDNQGKRAGRAANMSCCLTRYQRGTGYTARTAAERGCQQTLTDVLKMARDSFACVFM